MLERSLFFEAMDSRRSAREFSDRPVPQRSELTHKTASTAPSGYKAAWTFLS
jgi:hypothetical protein